MAYSYKNIGIVCYPTYGGSGVVATELGLALAKQGYGIHFISYKRPARLGSFTNNVYYHEVAPYEYPLFDFKPYDTALASKIVDVALHHKLDLLHVHYAIPHATIGFLAREILKTKGLNIPLISTLHGTDITLVGADPSFFPVVEFSINQCDGVTAVSESLRKQTFDTFDINRDIAVIPNFIDFTRFNHCKDSNLRKEIAPNGEKLLIHVSNFRKVKRIDDAIKVFAKIKDKLSAKLLLVGDGPERAGLEELARELKINESIYFLGKQDAVEELLAISDLFMLPSEHESFGLAALEAMACGLPVVSSNIGGLTEVNKDGYSGFTCPVGNVDYMAEKVLSILKDENSLSQYRKNALAQARLFSIETILPRYMDYYEEVIGDKST